MDGPLHAGCMNLFDVIAFLVAGEKQTIFNITFAANDYGEHLKTALKASATTPPLLTNEPTLHKLAIAPSSERAVLQHVHRHARVPQFQAALQRITPTVEEPAKSIIDILSAASHRFKAML